MNKRKNGNLRHAEYYEMTETFDELYNQSSKGKRFSKLMQVIESEANILLAYRNIKRNSGSITKGCDGITIKDIEVLETDEFIRKVKKRFQHYSPRKVRRVEIPKPNGDIRPLGIPSIWDRIAQQCILQVLEPICEAKFNKHSFGFRPNCSAEQAVNDCMIRMNISKMHYVVDVDIKSFFDEVNHTKLMRQIWTMGIQDKQLLIILRKMLKAPIELLDGAVVFPKKGTPQGGILSPLLANINLNEFDWWVYNQWEGHKVEEVKPYYRKPGIRATKHEYDKLRKTTKLKEMYLVRYADDFKIFTNTRTNAQKIFKACQMWLHERLKLPISKEKSKIINLKKERSEFLGFTMKLQRKGNRQVCQTYISPKALDRIKNQLKTQVRKIQKQPTSIKMAIEVSNYNSKIIGIHNYYKIATQVNRSLQTISWELFLMMVNRFEKFTNEGTYKGKDRGIKPYLKSKMTKYLLGNIPVISLGYVQHRNPMGRNRKLNKYTAEGRAYIQKVQSTVSSWKIRWIRENPIRGPRGTVELNDNRVSLFIGQKGKCAVTGNELNLTDMHCHHKVPWNKTQDDSYRNLILVDKDIHKLIHSKDMSLIKQLLDVLKLNENQLERLNKFRNMAGRETILLNNEEFLYEQLKLF